MHSSTFGKGWVGMSACPLVVLACESLHVCTVCIWRCEHARFCVEVILCVIYKFSFIHSFTTHTHTHSNTTHTHTYTHARAHAHTTTPTPSRNSSNFTEAKQNMNVSQMSTKNHWHRCRSVCKKHSYYILRIGCGMPRIALKRTPLDSLTNAI